tara:strand:- start:175 stop:516 length:342 start_codon:yes stop_codon:yes gene_type:complete
VKTILKKVINLETKRHDFDNDFAYIEIWKNARLKDCYFAEKQYLWPDGSLKRGGLKYFYSPSIKEEVEKEIKPVDYNKFRFFGRLFYFNEDGEICQIDNDQSNLKSSFSVKVI